MSKRNFSTPHTEVHAMIAQTFQDAFSPQWIKIHLPNATHDLILLHHIIPWQSIIERLTPFYHPHKGRTGHSLRTLVATSILCRLRQLSDRKVIENIQENRYMQYFCNIPDQRLMTFLNPSTLCRFRKRLGQEGTLIIEEQAFDKMAALATDAKLDLWWDPSHIKQRWRAYNLNQKDRLAYLKEFSTVFVPALASFAAHLEHLPESPLRQRWSHLLAVLRLLQEQTQQKLAGQSHIDHRFVSLDDLDARPIKKGKSHPSTEFGTTLQMTFNRQGFMMTTDNFIGQPNDKTLYGPTLQRFRERMHTYPGTAVTDLGFRSANNLKLNAQHIDHVFMGRSLDVDKVQQEACRKARSATEGFIAVAKHLRGFARSLYRGLQGAILWTRLGQCAYNLHKFLQLYRAEALEESTLLKLRL